ncbi:reverse transcriptase [Plakobranchus ocellatus]|uniref:Reverse transcriptase n=1 Tax=Plakobranchus ocellatus TaxID=259542 RepID=A0AAV4BGT7_9GAST|nr:reverse transcriptase [Plakobranchus ocellatus]
MLREQTSSMKCSHTWAKTSTGEAKEAVENWRRQCVDFGRHCTAFGTRRTAKLKQSRIYQEKTKAEEENNRIFFKEPFQVIRQLFQQLRSGIFALQKEEFEAHFGNTYSDAEQEKTQEDIEGLVWPSAPGVIAKNRSPKLDSVVRRARS